MFDIQHYYFIRNSPDRIVPNSVKYKKLAQSHSAFILLSSPFFISFIFCLWFASRSVIPLRPWFVSSVASRRVARHVKRERVLLSNEEEPVVAETLKWSRLSDQPTSRLAPFKSHVINFMYDL